MEDQVEVAEESPRSQKLLKVLLALVLAYQHIHLALLISKRIPQAAAVAQII